ncbi:MAG: S41 family peptidase [Schleiferiaceae bacterium]|nr:S41 family peptidase [Schleiferiaceae bacterium]
MRKFLLGLTAISAALLMSASQGDSFETSKQLEIFTNVLREVQTQYVDEISPEEAVGSAIRGMLSQLDPYTVYYPEDQIEDVRLLQTGAYGGIGCTIQRVEDKIFISSLHPGGPAHKAGLHVGDQIRSVSNTSTTSKTTSEVSTLLKGTPGTEVTLEIGRYNTPPKTYTFNRADIVQNPVPYYGLRVDGTGYIYLDAFTERASAEVGKAIKDLKEQGANAFILDLRGNGGGLLMEAVKIVSFFVETTDTVVSTRGRGGKIQDVYRTQGRDLWPTGPVAVLIDGSSASASEIVAGALQDFDRAVILGQQSFGKGLVQQVHPLPFGAQMKVTIAKYYTPSGRCIQKVNYDRGEDGEREQKQVSKIFTTAGGRPVVDGDGIAPDSVLQSPYYPEAVAALNAKALDLKFAGRILPELDSSIGASQFRMSEDLWNSFTSVLEEEEFEFTSIGELQLKRLLADVHEMDYITEADVKSWMAVLAERRGKVLETDKDAISEYLEDYLVSKKYGTAGTLERGLQADEVVIIAADILHQPSTIERLLSVK